MTENNLPPFKSQLIEEVLTQNGAINLVAVNLQDSNNITDNVIIVTATSTTHAKTLAEKTLILLKQHKCTSIHVDGLDSANWIAIDSGNTVIHIFLEPVRQYYKIEKIWLSH